MLNFRLVTALALLFALVVCPLQAKMLPDHINCDFGKGTLRVEHVESVTVRLTPQDGTCHLEVLDVQGNLVFQEVATGIQVSSVLHLTPDRRRFLLVQGDSSPNRLTILTVGPRPGILATVKNGYGFTVEDGCSDGRWHIWTADDAFQRVPELADVYHNDLFVPEVALDVRGDKLIDATSGCKPHFDRRVAGLRALLTAREIAAFKNHAIKDTFRSGQVKAYVLYIAFDYLYTGREQAAHEVLRKMWPADDAERVWNWMLQKRSEGILKHLEETAAMQ